MGRDGVRETAAPSAPDVRRAEIAAYLAFIGAGFAFASWASRIPQVRDRLEVTPAALGLILLSLAAGSLIALPAAGVIVTRLGATRSVAASALVLSAGLVVVAVGYRWGTLPVIAGLFLFGVGQSVWDVSMNVEGAAVERQLGRSVMPRFHAGFSVGTVLGALVGAGMVAAHVPVTAHLLGVALVVAVAVPYSVRNFLEPVVHETRHDLGPRRPLAAWTERRTLLVGVFVLCMAFTEGTGNDWLGIAMIDGHHASPALGTLTLAVFLMAMTGGRWFGPGLIDRFGRAPTLRASALVAFAGLMLVVFGHFLAIAIAGSVLWGLGAALGFPVGMSAAAEEPRYAAGRVSVVSSIAYSAFLAGPPVIGIIGNHVGVLRALTVAAGLLAVAAVLAGQCRMLVADPALDGQRVVS
ncbi:MAG: MFS transporter [Actinomycetota bacterium]|nr:MFS transporter [Actinomycetota bacterium]